MEKMFKRVGVIGRFRPLHIGSANMLDALCECSEHVIIGIGSANRYNVRSSFTTEETKEMIDLYLSNRFSNYEIISIDDFGHLPEFRDGQRWREEILNKYGTLDMFVAGNAYVLNLLKEWYKTTHPSTLVPPEKRVPISGTMTRIEMAKAGNWEQYVPLAVAAYLKEKGLVERFRKEFGLQTLMLLAEEKYPRRETLEEERAHISEE